MDVRSHNRDAWNQCVDNKNRWTQPVSADEIARARRKEFNIVLTPRKPVPAEWFPELEGLPTLCLASAGGQQAPILAAAGAAVTVFDNSPRQLDQDRLVAMRENLQLEIVEGDMADLAAFDDNSFGLIFHPCSNSFVSDILPVWLECSRTLRPGGILLSGFTNSVRYIFDDERTENGSLEVRHSLPYTDLDHLDDPHIQRLIESGQPLEFGHTLEDQIGGQLSAGLVITGFYEDRYRPTEGDPISQFMSTFIATRATKPE